MANFPTSAPSFSAKSNGQTIDASHINSLQDEVVAIGGGYVNGTAPLNSSNSTVANLSVTSNSTISALNVTTFNCSSAVVSGATIVRGDVTTLNVAGALASSGGIAFTSTLTPAVLSTGDNADYFPTGISSAFAIRIEGNSSGSTIATLGAIVGGIRLLVNVGVPTVGIKHEGLGTATNRIWMRSGTDTSLAGQSGTMLIWYDNTTQRWREIG